MRPSNVSSCVVASSFVLSLLAASVQAAGRADNNAINGVDLLSGFNTLWTPGATWNTGTPTALGAPILQRNVQYVVDLPILGHVSRKSQPITMTVATRAIAPSMGWAHWRTDTAQVPVPLPPSPRSTTPTRPSNTTTRATVQARPHPPWARLSSWSVRCATMHPLHPPRMPISTLAPGARPRKRLFSPPCGRLAAALQKRTAAFPVDIPTRLIFPRLP